MTILQQVKNDPEKLIEMEMVLDRSNARIILAKFCFLYRRLDDSHYDDEASKK